MSLLLNFNVSLFHRIQRSPSDPTSLSQFPVFSKPSSLHSLSLSKSHICFTFSPSSSPNYDREEARWLREEQRWLREEQRWLREESRWNSERESLLSEIQTLKLRIQDLERQNSVQGRPVTETVANLAKLLQA
ncbi:unnamed protein product [Ilex paraguariensis]|uniref:Uncharacterized protein n=1 Tax=Ilex paraguariensis TaxID=185542 RepID=A0ABC8TWH5_9AQUA